jgi:hypothetical protein
MQNVQILLQGHSGRLPASDLNLSTNLALWRIQHIRPHLGIIVTNLDVIDRALGMLSVDASLPSPLGMELATLRRLATELRAEATETQQMLDRQQGDGSSDQTPLSDAGASTSGISSAPPIAPGAPIMTPAVPITSQPRSQNATHTMPADAPAELFLLSSPQGPVGILFDQQGTYTTAPMVSTLPFQTFTNQFAQNRQLIAGLGQQMAQSAHQMHNQEVYTRGNEAQQPVTGGQAQAQEQAQDQAQGQNQNQNQNHQAPLNAPANPAAEPDRVVNVGAHLWLIFKLACFVYFFSGGSGYYRPVMLGLIACIVYLAQIGIFEDQINVLRRHFEALLPTGAWAAAPNDNQQQQQQTNAAANRHNLTPEEAARRLMEQRRGGNGANNGNGAFGVLREGMRSVERAFALFVASLFPGVGERMVHAQEERERLERVRLREEEERERERQRAEEEARRVEQEQEKKDGDGGAGEGEASNKGKERAEHTEGEGEGEGSA